MKKNILHFISNFTHRQMESFIIEEESGKIIVIDGGYPMDAVHLVQKLREITGAEVPHIDAWIFTHPHIDHMGAFYCIMKGMPKVVTFDKIYIHLPSAQYLAPDKDDGPEMVETFFRLAPAYADKIVWVSEDDIYQFGSGCKIEILYTADCSIKNNLSNNASTVFKMTLGEKTIMFLGDLGVEGGEKLLRTKKDRLKSDFCQMAHHGQNGVDRPVYEAIAPEACFWCAPDWLWNNDRGKGYNTHTYKTIIVRKWMEELGVQKHYVIKDGDVSIEC